MYQVIKELPVSHHTLLAGSKQKTLIQNVNSGKYYVVKSICIETIDRTMIFRSWKDGRIPIYRSIYNIYPAEHNEVLKKIMSEKIILT